MIVWRLMACHDADYYDEVVKLSRRNREIAIGWGDTGDLRHIGCNSNTDIARRLAKLSPHRTATSCTNAGQSLWRLFNDMKVGDLVILNTDRRVLTMRVTGDYYFVDRSWPPFYEHRRKAEEVSIDPDKLWQLSGRKAAGQSIFGTLIRCAKEVTDAQFKALVG